jgi:hypothetical protein
MVTIAEVTGLVTSDISVQTVTIGPCIRVPPSLSRRMAGRRMLSRHMLDRRMLDQRMRSPRLGNPRKGDPRMRDRIKPSTGPADNASSWRPSREHLPW